MLCLHTLARHSCVLSTYFILLLLQFCTHCFSYGTISFLPYLLLSLNTLSLLLHTATSLFLPLHSAIAFALRSLLSFPPAYLASSSLDFPYCTLLMHLLASFTSPPFCFLLFFTVLLISLLSHYSSLYHC